MKPEHKRSVSIEDLLRLKRTERPVAEFWADFDRQLRAKQLSALVGKRPWWQSLTLARAFSGFRRYHLPLGATAVVAITFVSMRMNQPVAPVALAPVAGLSDVPVLLPPVAPVPGEIAGEAAVALPEKSVSLVASAAVGALGSASEFASDEVPKGALFRSTSLRRLSSSDPVAATATWPADAGLVVANTMEPMFSRTLQDRTIRFEARTAPARSTVEPLHQITPPSERRGSRILTAMVSMAAVETAMRTTERAASRLSEEQLYDQIHRFGARGAGVSVKF